jgi:hypothetical protein
MKAAVIDRLFAGDEVDADSVLISEMMVGNWTRRADIVLANGKLCAFELKSEADRLTRLAGQLEAFSYHFEKLIVVVAARFEEAARAMLSANVGLWIAESDGSLSERVKPKLMPLAKEASIALMTATELRRLLSCNGLTGIKEAPRQQLEEFAVQLPQSDLANAARDAVKRRHRPRHSAFVKLRGDVGTMSAMPTLRRFGRRAPELQSDNIVQAILPEVTLPAHHPQLMLSPAGPVLKRLVRR